MPTLSIDIPAGISARVLDAMCATHGYQPTIPDPVNADGPYIPNPKTKLQFVKDFLTAYIKETVVAYEAQLAARNATSVAAATANSDINIT